MGKRRIKFLVFCIFTSVQFFLLSVLVIRTVFGDVEKFLKYLEKVASIEAGIFRNIDEIGNKKIRGSIAVAGDIEMSDIDKIEDVAILLASNEVAY